MLEISRNYVAPEAADPIYQEVTSSTQTRQSDQTVDEYIAEQDPMLRETGSGIETGTGFPEQSVRARRMLGFRATRRWCWLEAGEPGVRGCGREYATVIRILGRSISPRLPGHGGREWALGDRLISGGD